MTASDLPRILTPLTVAALVLAGLVLGGVWLALALAVLVALAVGLRPGAAGEVRASSPAWLPVALGVAHFAVLATAIAELAEATSPAGLIAAFVTAGLYLGQVSNPVAHELIHRRDRAGFTLGKWVYVSILFGHHTSAHRLVHHVHVATDRDPNSARAGESLYRFLPRAWTGSFRAGLAAERARSGGRFPWASYGVYLGGGLAVSALSLGLAGPAGLAAHWALSAYATVQLLTADYVQHYGLRRALGADGRPEPVGPQHSWDSDRRGPAWLMLNAPRHAGHHLRPTDPYGTLTVCGPVLPHSLAAMGALALAPHRWRRIMDRRLPQGQNFTS